jgi:hypothetical protein
VLLIIDGKVCSINIGELEDLEDNLPRDFSLGKLYFSYILYKCKDKRIRVNKDFLLSLLGDHNTCLSHIHLLILT